MPEPALFPFFSCCQHCEHITDHDDPHETPCDHGCNDSEMTEVAAAQKATAEAEARWSAIEGADD